MHPYAIEGNKSGAKGMKAGDRVMSLIDGRYGIADEFLQDGDTYITWDDGTYGNVKWNHLVKVPEQSEELIKVFTRAHIPRELRQKWLQHLRDFDIAHPGCHFEIMIDTPDISLSEAIEQIQVNPALTFSQILERK